MEKTNKVLTVEDNLWTALYVQDVLREAGYATFEPCTSYAEALAILVHASPTYAVVDLDLGGEKLQYGEEGERLLAILDTSGTGTVIHSGLQARFQTLQRYYPNCVFLPKPATPLQIVDALRQVAPRPPAQERPARPEARLDLQRPDSDS